MIRLADVTVNYGGVQAVDGISLNVASGEFVSLVGHSGCGKSSLAHAVCGFVPHGGRIDAPEEVGVVFQDYALFPFMTCTANVGLGLAQLSREQREKRVSECLLMVGLQDLGRRYPWQLSGGQQQRVAVARALARDPPCLVMDEPFAAVDVLLRDTLTRWLADLLATGGKTVIFITHSVEEAVWLSDRVIVMERGKVRREVSVELPRPRRGLVDPAFLRACEEVRTSIGGA